MTIRQLAQYLLILLCPTSALAEQQDPNWYQVEVFVFANTSDSAGANEYWPQNLGLSYPEKLLELQEDESPEDTSNNERSINLAAEESSAAFTLLAKDERQLSRHVRRLLRTGQHRLLFHEAWLQPMENRQQAVSILIRGGEQYDRHFELEGYLTLSVERYLHINTDLWLSRFASTIGTDQTPWPVLPTPPTVLKAEQQMADELNLKPSGSHNWGVQEQRPFELLFDQQYTVERTVAMRQHRRMRSQELHYLDHPLMGVLVKVIPYKQPEIIEEAPKVIEANTALPPSE
jgi:hypothetical protein